MSGALISPTHPIKILSHLQKFVLVNSDKADEGLETAEKTEHANIFEITTSMQNGTEFVDEDVALHYQHCAICMEKLEDGVDICSSHDHNCRHVFHRECIFEWLLKSQECPCCRRDYLNFESARDVEARLPSVTHIASSSASVAAGQDDHPHVRPDPPLPPGFLEI